MNIANRIDQLLKQRGWSAYRLAQEAGLPQSTLSNIFNRPYEPTISTMELICKGLGITLSQFFAGDGESISLTGEQRELLEQWGKLTAEQKESLLIFLKSL